MDTAHTVTVPVTALHLLENQIKTVKENLIRKQESLMQVGELLGILKKCVILVPYLQYNPSEMEKVGVFECCIINFV